MIQEYAGDLIQWLRGFVFVAQHGSLSRASKEMGRSLSAVHYQIKQLEKEFNVKLFGRHKGRLILTVEGQILLENVIHIFDSLNSLKGNLKKKSMSLEGQIRIATYHATTIHYLSKHIRTFSKRNERVKFELRAGLLNFILDQVESAEVDFGIVHSAKFSSRIYYYPLFESRLTLIAPRGNVFKISAEPTIQEISQLPFIGFPQSSAIMPTIEQAFAREEVEPRMKMVCNNFQMIKEYVRIGLGISIIAEYNLRPEDIKRFMIYKMDNYFRPIEYGLIILKGKYISPACRSFLLSLKPDLIIR
jgi:DNA-binding transcriptional LysR family regulator